MQCSMFPTCRNMEHCFLYARQTRLAFSSPLLSPCVYIHIGMDTRQEYRSPSVPAIRLAFETCTRLSMLIPSAYKTGLPERQAGKAVMFMCAGGCCPPHHSFLNP